MRTEFSPASLNNPDMAQSEKILRACVHCGFCNATCPTYLVTGDENDGPRGRIYLMREMLQSSAAPDARTVAHIDGCLSCLGCVTTCPSGVNYMRLVDHARAHIAQHYRRPLFERAFRAALNVILPHPGRFALARRIGRWSAPLEKLMPASLARMATMARQLPHTRPPPAAGVHPALGARRKRVILLNGCVQPALAPETNLAAIRLLTRLGVEVVVPPAAGCCGAISQHLGRTNDAKKFARANVAACMKEARKEGVHAVLMTASGCGSQVRDYGHLLGDDRHAAEDAANVSARAFDLGEFLAGLTLPAPVPAPRLRVAYHAPCSLQHGQKIHGKAEGLLRAAGFTVLVPLEAHLCCGAAGTYTLLQPEMSDRLAARKAENLHALAPDVIVSGNVGCQLQLQSAARLPVLHWVQLLDWAYGGPMPEDLLHTGAAGVDMHVA